MNAPSDRAIVFVDGNNFWHALRNLGLSDLGRLNYAIVSNRLLGPRQWVETRYYVGQRKNTGNGFAYNQQRVALNFLQGCDPRISLHLGRIESHMEENKTATQLKRYLADLNARGVRIDAEVFRDLVSLGNATQLTEIFREKAVDVALAVDMVVMAERNHYDAAYLLSADGDYTPAVKAVREAGKKVYVASPANGAQLAAVADSFIRLDKAWFNGCFA